uniref:Uncharacterized protein n=1 Tax=Glossina palpalis gambiensis TaxID=67801 RepID=A0A1B0AS85_9MUSC
MCGLTLDLILNTVSFSEPAPFIYRVGCSPQLGVELLVKCAPNTKCERLNRLYAGVDLAGVSEISLLTFRCEVLEHSVVLSKDDDEICEVTELAHDDELYGGVLSALLKLFSDKFSLSSIGFIGTVVMAPSDLI